jgi:hypothetical protein
MDKDTVCRVEENKHLKISAIEFINEVFNPTERLERLIVEQGRKMSKICDKFEKLAVLIQGQESNAGSLIH